MEGKQRTGVAMYDLQPLFTGKEVFVANGRKFVHLEHPLINECVGQSHDGTISFLEPIWSQEDKGDPLVLELIISKVVVPEGEECYYSARNDKVIDTYCILGRSSKENPGEVKIQTIPPKFSKMFKQIFPTDKSLSVLSNIAFAKLNQYDVREPLISKPEAEFEGDTSSPTGSSREEGEVQEAGAANGSEGELQTEEQVDMELSSDSKKRKRDEIGEDEKELKKA